MDCAAKRLYISIDRLLLRGGRYIYMFIKQDYQSLNDMSKKKWRREEGKR